MNTFSKVCHMVRFHPLVGFGVFVVDWILFLTQRGRLGENWPVTIGVCAALTVPCMLIQKYGLEEEWGLAIGKGLLAGVLTAVPTAIASLLMFAGAVLGIVTMSVGDGSADKDQDRKERQSPNGN